MLMSPRQVVQKFWEAMGSNDFELASNWLAEDFECIWVQSAEKITGRSNFVAINSNYPAQGLWTFHVNSIVCEENTVVTDVEVTDGHVKARAITFHTVENGFITRQKEFWPDNYDAPQWRRAWVELIDSDSS
jgi:ketosteroid isomerase-like protein